MAISTLIKNNVVNFFCKCELVLLGLDDFLLTDSWQSICLFFFVNDITFFINFFRMNYTM